MCHQFLSDARLYFLLFQIDKDLAQKTKAARCRYCHGTLHVSNYDRKPRGLPEELENNYRNRFSFSCYRCRLRTTPPSARFLGRKVYLGVVVVLVTAMQQGLSPQGEKVILKNLGVDRKTVKVWKKWWTETFPQTDFWKEARRQIAFSLPAMLKLPLSLLGAFKAESGLENLCRCLRFLSPASTLFEISLHARLWPC